MNSNKALLIGLCLLLMLATAGCGGAPKADAPAASDTTAASNAPAVQLDTPAEPEPAANQQPPQSVSLQNVDITIGGAEIVSIEGEQTLCVYVDCINNSDTILQTSNEAEIIAIQDGTELYLIEGVSAEEYAYSENFHRLLFPGVTIRAAQFFILEDESSEITLSFVDRNEDITQEITLALDALPTPVPLEMAEVPVLDIEALPGYAGTEATFEDSMWPDGEMALVNHEFIEQDDGTYIVLYFDLVFINNMEDGEEDSPLMRTHFYCFQDGVQLGESSVFDDQIGLETREEIPELAAQRENIGPNEPVQFATAFKLVSDTDIVVIAGFNWSDYSAGETFIGDIISVE